MQTHYRLPPLFFPMKNIITLLASILLLLSCGGDDDVKNVPSPDPTPPISIKLESQSISNGDEVDVNKTNKLTLTYNINVKVYSYADITLNGSKVQAKVNADNSKAIDVYLKLKYNTSYTLQMSEGAVVAAEDHTIKSPAYTLTFKTKEENQPGDAVSNISSTPVVATTDAAIRLYKFLLSNYQKNIITGMMAEVNWNNTESEKVYKMVGKYPAINGYDYIHLPYTSSGGWIDYGNITPVKTWADNKGIVTIGWHWNAPSTQDGTDYGFYKGTDSSKGETTFKIANAVTEGTWENQFIKDDLQKITPYLKLLKDAGIPVLWRPLHEASGGWFWWGAGTADQCKKLWVMMFDTFKAAGLTNLIWVWTDDKKSWYPGDAYVDIVGCDIYGDTAAECAVKYNNMQKDYSTKMVALTECGYSIYANRNIADIAAQWKAGALWSFFMPWYNAETHAPQTWWYQIKSASNVIWREDVNF